MCAFCSSLVYVTPFCFLLEIRPCPFYTKQQVVWTEFSPAGGGWGLGVVLYSFLRLK